MDPRRWKRLQEIFEKVVDLPPEKQAEALARECGEDDELRRRIESLLASSDRGTGLISGAIDRAAADTTGPAVAGERIGPYRLLEEIGSGGMGAVYLAERADEEFEQRVALKVVRAGALNPRIVERFLAERQFLARLDHPHIARLLDGGTTEAGVPYFIMEHVDGIPIDEYCDSKRLSTRERLELFRSVCGAVESAHRKLIVHRDIKPSNLLVTPEGVPKLLDFGIAKLVEPEAPGEALTVMGERAMTPEYASPEQVRGEPVSTATDVYALGLLLYKLLSGRRAHRITSYQPSDVERIVCEAIPERPSTAITSIPAEEPQTSGDGSTVTPESIGRARRTVPARLKKRLAGDLDNIVLMALRKEPERRYPSIEQLSEDIRRHLKGLPVLAHADSFGYRASKFVRRNAGGLTAAVLVFLSLAGGLVVSTVQAKRAKLEARHAAEVTDFLTGLLEVSDPELAQGREVPVREVLDLAAFRIEGELGDQPRVQARIGTLIGHLYHRIGQYEEADRLLSQALVRQEILLGANHLDVAATQQLVAELADSRGKYEAAEAAALANLEILEGRLGRSRPEVGEALTLLGTIYSRQGEMEESRATLGEARAIQERLLPDTAASLADTIYAQAQLEFEDGEFDLSEEFALQALELHRQLADGMSLAVSDTLRALSYPSLVRGKNLDQVEKWMLEALEIKETLLGKNHPQLVEILTDLGIVRRRQEDFAGAEQENLRALAIGRKALGPDHPTVGTVLNNLAVIFHIAERYGEAANYYSQALEVRRRALGDEHPGVGTTMSYLAFVKHLNGDKDAESLYRQALDHLTSSRGEKHPHVANVHNDLGRLLVDDGRLTEAEAHLRTALDVRLNAFGDDAGRTMVTKTNLGACLIGQNRFSEGDPLLEQARAWFAGRYGDEDWRTAEVDIFRALSLVRKDKRREARALIATTLDLLQEAKGPDHWLPRRARQALDEISRSAR